MIRSLLIATMVAMSAPSAAQAVAIAAPTELTAMQEAEITRLTNDFFGQVKAGRYEEAYKSAFSSPLMRKREADLESAAASTEKMFKTYGEIFDWEPVSEELVSRNFVRRLYMIRTSNAPVFFVIEYYFVGNRWTILKVVFNDNYSEIK